MAINCADPLRLVLAGGVRIGPIIAVGTGLPRTVSPYALSKHQFADWLDQLSGDRISPATVVELEHFYGPGDEPTKFLTRVARTCLAHQPLDLTAGTQLRDFIHLDDVVRGLMVLIDRPVGSFRRVPLGSGQAVTVRSVVEQIHAAAASRSILRFGAVPQRSREPGCCRADTAHLRSLGWSPTIPLASGIPALVASERC
jgi:nucleoside-diphosphate-sugar epimerase